MVKLILLGVGGVAALIFAAGSFTTITTGESGLYKSFDGKVQEKVLQPGIQFDGLGTIETFNTRKITVSANDLRPKTQDNTIMKDMDVTVTYSIDPSSLFGFYTGYDMSNHSVTQRGQIELMAKFIERLITSSVNQSVDEFPALKVNSSLEQIQEAIKLNLSQALEKNGLGGKIKVDAVIVGKADLPDDLVAAVNRVVTAQSKFKEQEQLTLTAKSKAEENKALASTVTPESLKYQQNEILKKAFESGSVKMIIVNGAKMDFLPSATLNGN